MAIMQVTTSVAFSQVVLSVTGMLVDLSVTVGDCFCCNYAVKGFCSTYTGNNSCNKYVDDNFYCNYADGTLLQLCWWYFLQCIIYMTVSCNNFIFRSLTDTLSS